MNSQSNNSIENTLGLTKNPKKSYKKYLWTGFVLLLAASGGGWYAYIEKADENLNYQTAPAERKTITTTVSATGNMEPTNTVDVGIEVSGTISEVLVDYNERVHTGQLMARLDTVKLSSKVTSYQAALSKFEANIAEAMASKNKAQNEWERVEKMVKATNGNYPSRQDVDSAFAALESAKASVQAAKAARDQANAELKAIRDDLRKAVVLSPINGIVLERKVEPGQTVVAAMQTPILFKLAQDLTKMKVIVSVDEADIGEVKEGQKAKFSVDAYPQKLFDGTLTQLRLNSQIVNGVVTYNAVVSVENPELLLRPGMTASAQIITGVLNNALTVPNAALRFNPTIKKDEIPKNAKNNSGNSMPHVWIVRKNKPFKIEVETGKSDGSSTIITKGEIEQNDLVLIGTKEP